MRSRLLAALIALSSLPAAASSESDAEAAYQEARSSYYALKGDEARRKFRHNWLNVVHRFERVAAKYPKSERAPDALFTAAQTLEELSRISRLDDDLASAMQDYEKLATVHPKHHLADDAGYLLARILRDRLGKNADARKTASRALSQLPKGDRASEIKALLSSLGDAGEDNVAAAAKAEERKTDDRATAGARSDDKKADGTKPDDRATHATRADDKKSDERTGVAARSDDKKSDERAGVAARLDDKKSDERNSTAARGDDKKADGKKSDERARAEAQVRPEQSRTPADEAVTASGEPTANSRIALVEAIERLARSQAPLYQQKAEVPAEMEAEAELVATKPAEKAREPDRSKELAAVDPKAVKARLKAAVQKDSEITLAEQLGLKVRRVVIDPGHGGHDSGAIGPSGAQEKEVALAISKKLAKELTRAGLEVVLTRDEDKFVRLEDRADLANDERGDLFISIHCNSAPKKKLRGIETYTLNTSADRYSIRLAARENASSEKSISDLQFILADLATKANTEESSNLANQVQRSLVTKLGTRYKDIRDLGHKQALFYVLLGTRMPAILVETSFLSNPDEEKRLASGEYQDAVAAAIAAGVQEFLGNREKLAKVD